MMLATHLSRVINLVFFLFPYIRPGTNDPMLGFKSVVLFSIFFYIDIKFHHIVYFYRMNVASSTSVTIL
jgi:hypothetical protein